MFSFLASSCNDGVAYNKSADVHQQGWMPADTLSFELYVYDSANDNYRNSIFTGHQYSIGLNFRYSEEFKYTSIPIHIKTDSANYFVNPNLHRKVSWSAIQLEECIINNINVSFADTGYHSIQIYPDTILNGILSVGLELYK